LRSSRGFESGEFEQIMEILVEIGTLAMLPQRPLASMPGPVHAIACDFASKAVATAKSNYRKLAHP